jgi:hypothetical protein
LYRLSLTLIEIGSVKNFLIAAIVATSTGMASAATILSETFQTIANPPGDTLYSTVNGGNTFSGVNTWLVGGNSIDIINNNYGAPDGSIGIDLNGNAPGSISTTVATAAGLSLFTLSFDSSVNTYPGYSGQTLSWTVGSQTGVFTPEPGGPNSLTVQWYATGGSPINVSFAGDPNTSAYGPTIDNIRLDQVVSAVPEPGEWAMMLAGLAMVGAISRKRKGKLA